MIWRIILATFSITGYGTMTPTIDSLRLFMIGYSMIGIPLCSVVMARMAEFFSKGVSKPMRVC